MDEVIEEIFAAILRGDRNVVVEHMEVALNSGFSLTTILNEGMIAAMNEVGQRFEVGECFVPEMMISARAMKEGLEILKPHLVQANVQTLGKVVVGTVRGDLHDIGKNLVGMMLEGGGFEVLDLGINVPPEKFVEVVSADAVDVIGISALLTTTMQNMQATIAALEEHGLRAKVKVIVGGAPVTEEYAQQIGADGYAPDASRAVTLAKSLIK